MTTLGIGTPVRIGWCAPTNHPHDASWARFHRGVIVDGPQHLTYADVDQRVFVGSRRLLVRYPTTYWLVEMDGGGLVNAEEWLLTPDDGEHEADLARRGMAVET